MKDKTGRKLPWNRSLEVVKGELQCMQCSRWCHKEDFYPDGNIPIESRIPHKVWKLFTQPLEHHDTAITIAKKWKIPTSEAQFLLDKGRIQLGKHYLRPHAVALPYEVQSYCVKCRKASENHGEPTI